MNVLIIGASSGIGRESAHVFAQEGHNVICSSRDKEELEYLVSDLKVRYDCQAYAVSVDLTQLSKINNYVAEIYKIVQTLDCVIVTVGTMPADQVHYSNQKELLDTAMTNYIGIAAVLNEISIIESLNSGKLLNSSISIPVKVKLLSVFAIIEFSFQFI